MCGIIALSVFVIYLFNLSNKFMCLFYVDFEVIELSWTIAPSFVLLFLGVPSLKILYQIDVYNELPLLTVKILAHQWYWTYDYSDFKNIEFDSFIVKDTGLIFGDFKYISVDNRCVFPINSLVRLIFSSRDVLHSWTVPNLRIKVDCVPGKLNQAYIKLLLPSLSIGQCSEICGAYHRFIPIVIETTTPIAFTEWVRTF